MVYLTYNSSRTLRASLQSITGIGQEVLVVDSGSSDDTLEIANSFGARVLNHSWEGFAKQRNWALAQAINDWVLMMDSDEVLTSDGREKIQQLLQQEPAVSAYFLMRYSVFHGRRINFGDWRHDETLRIFDRRRGAYDPDDLVHESWHCEGKTGNLPGYALAHHSYASLVQLMEKTQRYAELNAQLVKSRGHAISSWTPTTHAFWTFFRAYILRLGILDGVDGAAIAWTTALGAFMKYAIAREMQLQDKENS
ncbi:MULTISPECIES: glycosyltransferase family 2 protein [unclassified Acidithiobacillus]|uniref:glycosyltransferase family 2 protein n=1 Tax=unclassified Acidithiobacillus TaxID=2614800 RepID=UPI0029D41B96|nr:MULTISPECIES: glycosyltransferase family 2 protein [unclassified Acidithiobacillus]